MMFGIFMGFLAVMVGLLLAAVIVAIIMLCCGRSIVNSFTRLINAIKRLFTPSVKVKEVHTYYEEGGIKKEKVEVMK